jgi:hypothetical protein
VPFPDVTFQTPTFVEGRFVDLAESSLSAPLKCQ